MNSKSIFTIFFVLILLIFTNNASAETVTVHSGEYATDLTTFEYKLTNVVDDGWLKIYWSFNSTGDTIRFELGTSVLSEDFIDVLDTGVYLIPLDIYVNDVELDVNANATFYEYWEEVLWNRMILPIEDGQYNNFDVLEDQDPANWDVKGDEVSFFTSQTEWVYDYNTGVAKSWTSTVSYDFTLVYIEPPVTTSEVNFTETIVETITEVSTEISTEVTTEISVQTTELTVTDVSTFLQTKTESPFGLIAPLFALIFIASVTIRIKRRN